MVKDVTLKEFERVSHKGIAVVDFYTTWCGDCRVMAPVYEEVAKKYTKKGVKFYSVDAEKAGNYGKPGKYQIVRVPTFIVFKDGKEIARGIEYTPKWIMEKWMEEALK